MWNLQVQNIAGIKRGNVEINQGTNVIQASNFQGKSSLIEAIQTVMGTTGGEFGDYNLTEGENSGHVLLETEEGEYRVELTKQGTISMDGDTYLTDKQDKVCARLFAFLGEDNPIRSAVRNDDSKALTEELQKPLEVERIDARVTKLQEERKDIKADIRAVESAKEKLPKLQEDVTQLEKKLEELREQESELEEEVDEDNQQKEISNELSNKRSTLKTTQRKIDRIESRIETKESQLESKKSELEELESPTEPDEEVDIQNKKEKVSELNMQIELLSELYRTNKTVLDDNELDLVSNVRRGISGDSFTCWLSGDETTREEVTEHLNKLNEKRKKLSDERSDLQSEIDEIEEEREKARKARRKSDQLNTEIKELEMGIKEDKQELETQHEKLDGLKPEIEELEDQFEEVKQEKSEELSDVRTEIGSKENQLKRKQEKLEETEAETEQEEDLDSQLEELNDKITDLRKRRDKKNREIKDRFDTAFEEVVERFAPGFDGANLRLDENENRFYIEVVREEGRRTDIKNLSEGETELIGFITTLAGFRTFNVDERVPVMLVDGIGQLAAENIRGLINYLQESTEILVTTAYPEAGEFEGKTLNPDDWEVISNEITATA
jgi:DNA repair exonuclease SbcCD ATPase subunit